MELSPSLLEANKKNGGEQQMFYDLETQLRLLDFLHQQDPVKALAQYFAAVERLSGRGGHESEASGSFLDVKRATTRSLPMPNLTVAGGG